MKPMYLVLEDGAVFEGRSVSEALECAGLLSFYTGVVGYQEVITDPANLGKIVVFTYPLIGNYGVNSVDAESSWPKVAGLLCKEYPPYYSNFRAEGNLKDYLDSPGTVFGHKFDTRAILLHLREHGEMGAAISGQKLDKDEAKKRIAEAEKRTYLAENNPVPCENAKVRAAVLDFGASKTFYTRIASLGVDATGEPEQADIVLVSDAPYYSVEDADKIDQVRKWIGKKPVIGLGHGSALVAQACGGRAERMKFGDHGVNVPVRYSGGGRNEITVQNHSYVVSDLEVLFENVHDGTCEGFASDGAAGSNFLPTEKWFDEMLGAIS